MATDLVALKHGDVASQSENNVHSGCKSGPGYASPLEAMSSGPREKLIYVTCIYSGTTYYSKLTPI